MQKSPLNPGTTDLGPLSGRGGSLFVCEKLLRQRRQHSLQNLDGLRDDDVRGGLDESQVADGTSDDVRSALDVRRSRLARRNGETDDGGNERHWGPSLLRELVAHGFDRCGDDGFYGCLGQSVLLGQDDANGLLDEGLELLCVGLACHVVLHPRPEVRDDREVVVAAGLRLVFVLQRHRTVGDWRCRTRRDAVSVVSQPVVRLRDAGELERGADGGELRPAAVDGWVDTHSPAHDDPTYGALGSHVPLLHVADLPVIRAREARDADLYGVREAGPILVRPLEEAVHVPADDSRGGGDVGGGSAVVAEARHADWKTVART